MGTVARLKRRAEELAQQAEQLLARRHVLSNEHDEKSREEQLARAAQELLNDNLREAGEASRTAAQVAVEATAAATTAEERQRDAEREVRSLTADVEHLTASLRDLEDVDAPTLAVAETFRGTVRFSSAVTCPAGLERALAAALAQANGGLAVPSEVDHWSLLAALKRAGITLARLIVAHGQQPQLQMFPGATPLLAEVQTDGRREVEEALADAVLVDDLRQCPPDFPGLAVTREGGYYRAEVRPARSRRGRSSGPPLRAARDARPAEVWTELETSRRPCRSVRC